MKKRAIFLSMLIAFFSACAIAFLIPLEAHAAASLYLSPAGGSFVIGSTFTISVYVDTGGQAINAVEADMVFPPDELQVVSPSTGNSFVQIWTVQPSYSNIDGTIKFQGALPSPGITTDAGLVSTITFRVKNSGNAYVKFTDGSRVLSNDGKATDILDKLSGANYALTLPPPQGPFVISRTNPDQNKWYTSPVVSFEWTASPNVEGYSYMLDDDPAAVPDDVSEGTSTRMSFDSVPDGKHYFHIKAMREGVWGGVTDYEVNLDRTPPALFPVNVAPSAYTSARMSVVTFASTDKASGVDHYELSAISLSKGSATDNTPFFIEAQSPYVRNFDPGQYEIVVRAYDAAGNYSQSQTMLVVANPIFEVVGEQGVRIGGVYTLAWPWAFLIGIIILFAFAYGLNRIWKIHLLFEDYLRRRKENEGARS